MENTTQIIDWKCNTCDQTEGVENGICPTCGPTQTTPLSEAAQKEAGVAEAAAERAAQEAAKVAGAVIEGEIVEPTSTEQ